jgi:Icc-related predicted phosphoesterase
MLLQYASDLHLEFPKNKALLKANPLVAKANILILAGDVVPFNQLDKHQDFFDEVSDTFEQVYWIPGNHEYYYFDAADKRGSFFENIRTNVSLVNNWSLKIEAAHLIFSTLWSAISTEHQWYIEKNMNDFRLIKYNRHQFSFEQYNQLHTDSLAFIKTRLVKSEPDTKKVVVTHHVPTYMNYPEQYKGNKLSEAFTVELFDLITDTQPDFWIYGHHHVNVPDFEIGKTRLLTNQLGYVHYEENLLFSPEKTFLL